MPDSKSPLDSSAPRNALVLSLAQAVNGSIGAIAISLGGWSGAYLLPGNPALHTLPIAGYSIGVAVFASLVALLSHNWGRKLGFISGAVIGIFGAALACFALVNNGFWMFCAAFLLIGGSSAFVQQYRFAAADQGDDKFKSRAISWVLTGGVLAAFIGPQIVMRTKDALLPIPFAGAFVAMAALLVGGVIILSFLSKVPALKHDAAINGDTGRSLFTIIKQPVFLVALLCAISSFALMTFMMTGAPLAMTHNGHSHDQAVTGIQWHILAMYAPSFITGSLIVRFGKIPVIAIGLALLLLCAGIALAGLELWNFWTSLILLGIGWNFGFIGATALLGESYTAAEKNKVQGGHDTILFSFVAMAALLSGATLNSFGWHGVATVLLPIASISLLALLWLAISKRKQST